MNRLAIVIALTSALGCLLTAASASSVMKGKKDTRITVTVVDCNGEPFKGKVDVSRTKVYPDGQRETLDRGSHWGPTFTISESGYTEFPYNIVMADASRKLFGEEGVEKPSDYDPYERETRIGIKVQLHR